jgi:hypothetical protein
MATAQEIGAILEDSTIYQCKSSTCSDNGGVCTLIIPVGFEPPTSCTNSESFTDNADIPDCKWRKI